MDSTLENQLLNARRNLKALEIPSTRSRQSAAPPAVLARLQVARRSASATALSDGTVLVAGGIDVDGEPLASTELITGDSVRPGPALPSPRCNHTALQLADGSVALVGGTAVAIDRLSNGRWVRGADLPLATIDPAFAALADGRVLAVGGGDIEYGYSADAFLYDPRRDRWKATRGLTHGRGEHAALALGNGRVIVVGGTIPDGDSDVEIFDPKAERWRSVAMPSWRYHVALAEIAGGRVLVIGGTDKTQDQVFELETGAWSSLASVHGDTKLVTAIALPDGKIFVLEGSEGSLFDGATCRALGPVAPRRTHAAIVARRDGTVLVIGGYRWGKDEGATDEVLVADLADGAAARPRPPSRAAGGAKPKQPARVSARTGTSNRERSQAGGIAGLEGRGLRIVRHWQRRRSAPVVGRALAGTSAAWGSSGIELRRLGSTAAPRPLSGSRDATRIALSANSLVAAGDGVAAWDTRRGDRLWSHDEIDEDGAYMLAISPGGELAITGGEDRIVRAFAVRTGELVWQRDTYKMVWGGCFSRSGKRVAISDWGGLLVVAEAATGAPALEASCGMLPAALAFAPSGKQLLVGAGHFDEHGPLDTRQGPLSVFDLAGKRMRAIDGYTHGIAGVAMLGDDRFATASYDGTVRVHALRSGAELGRLDLSPLRDHPTALAVDGTTILVGTRRGTVLQLAATPNAKR